MLEQAAAHSERVATFEGPIWDNQFTSIVFVAASRSTDQDATVGAVPADFARKRSAVAYNCQPRETERLPDHRPDKYPIRVHADVNASRYVPLPSRDEAVVYLPLTPREVCSTVVANHEDIRVRHIVYAISRMYPVIKFLVDQPPQGARQAASVAHDSCLHALLAYWYFVPQPVFDVMIGLLLADTINENGGAFDPLLPDLLIVLAVLMPHTEYRQVQPAWPVYHGVERVGCTRLPLDNIDQASSPRRTHRLRGSVRPVLVGWVPRGDQQATSCACPSLAGWVTRQRRRMRSLR